MSAKTKNMDALAAVNLLLFLLEATMPHLKKVISKAQQQAIADRLAAIRAEVYDGPEWKPSK